VAAPGPGTGSGKDFQVRPAFKLGGPGLVLVLRLVLSSPGLPVPVSSI